MPTDIEVSPEAAATIPKGNEQITLAPEHATAPAAETVTEGEVTPPAKAEDSTMDEFDAVKNELNPAPVVLEKKGEKKVETPAKVEAPVIAKVDPKAVVKPGGRDYTAFPAEMHTSLRAMSNEGFNVFKKVYSDNVTNAAKVKELEAAVKVHTDNPNRIPDSYYEHPLAFALTPEYETAAKQAQESQTIFQHWSEQLKAVQDGAATYKTLVRDPKTGAISYGQDVPTDKNSAINLLAFFNQTQNRAAQFEGALSQMQTSHGAKYKEQVDTARSLEAKMFAEFEKPEHPAHAQIKATIEELPAAFRKSPLASGYAKALVTVQALMNLITKERAEHVTGAAAKEKIAATTKAAGPLETGVTGGVQKSAITTDDFDAVKERDV